MEITFYAAPMSSAVPVASALAELEIPHRRQDLDLSQNEQKRPEFLALNPNGKVPTLVVDGAPIFEALAILEWLGDRFGVERGVWPAADTPERGIALSWSAWAYVSYCGPTVRLWLASSPVAPEALRSTAAADNARREIGTLLDILDGRLAETGHLLGADFTLVDLIVGSMVLWSQRVGVVTKEHAHVTAWLERTSARPSIRNEWA